MKKGGEERTKLRELGREKDGRAGERVKANINQKGQFYCVTLSNVCPVL